MVQYIVEENGVGDKTLVCAFSEKLDTANCAYFETELIEKVRDKKYPVSFDLEKVDYIASSFLRLCLRTAKEVGTKNFALVNVHPSVKKVFMIAGFDKELNIA